MSKNLKYYLDHPDDMPTDPKEIERLANEHMSAALESGQDQLTIDKFVKPEQDEKGESSTAEVKDPPKEDAANETEPAEEKPAVAEIKPEAKPEILARDGKNLIPYSQLESARARATAAEALIKEREAEIERLKSEKVSASTDLETLTEEELETLEADSPTLAKTLRALQNANQKLADKVQELEIRSNDQVANEVSVIKDEIQTAIDGNPTLASWQTAEDQTMWKEASKFDRLLRESPKYANVSFADRFEKVVELTQSALGLEPEEAPKEETTALTREQIKATAQAKLKAKPVVPKSLSDIPGGAPPAVDEKDKVEQMSTIELGQQFLGMTKDQLDAYLASL